MACAVHATNADRVQTPHNTAGTESPTQRQNLDVSQTVSPPMADIQQWRRRVQSSSRPVSRPSSRPQTPSDMADERQSETGSNPGTPKRRSRPRIARLVQNYLTSASSSKNDSLFDYPSWSSVEPIMGDGAQHDPVRVGDTLLTQLVSGPYKPLPVHLNSPLLYFVEAFRDQLDAISRLKETLNEKEKKCWEFVEAIQEAERTWAEEESNYRAEIKRLELVIAEGKRGLEDLIKSREGSLIKRKRTWKIPKKETSDIEERSEEPVERNRRKARHSARESGRERRRGAVSPSRNMAALSHKLATTSFHEDVPVGTPPSGESGHRLTKVSLMEGLKRKAKSYTSLRQVSLPPSMPPAHAEAPTSSYEAVSECSTSTFSTGDPLPDEIEETDDTLKANEDFTMMRDLAVTIARHRGILIELVLPQLVDIFAGAANAPQVSGPGLGRPQTFPQDKVQAEAIQEIQDTSSAKQVDRASAPNYSLLRSRKMTPSLPLMRNEGEGRSRRPFSFIPGDDMALTPTFEQQTFGTQTPLRKAICCPATSAAPDALDKAVAAGGAVADYSPFQSSNNSPLPSPPLPALARRVSASKIPSPSQDLAMARSRERSMSSLRATLHEGDDAFRGRVSSTSSTQSVITAVRNNSGRNSRTPSASASRTPSGSHRASSFTGAGALRLVEHKNSLRNQMVAEAAARTANGGSLSRHESQSHLRRPNLSGRSSDSDNGIVVTGITLVGLQARQGKEGQWRSDKSQVEAEDTSKKDTEKEN